jgi:hypothetical protein
MTGGADMQRAGSSSVLAGEVRKRQHLVLVDGAHQGRRRGGAACSTTTTTCRYY